MSASAPDVEAPAEDPGALTGDQARFVASLLGQNARWSASIHNAALDGQERASNEWAARYLALVQSLEFAFLALPVYERESILGERIDGILGAQSFYPDHAAEQIERYRARLEKRKAAAPA